MLKITLNYHFDDIRAECGRGNDPDYWENGITEVDFDYEVLVDYQDIVQFFIDEVGEYSFNAWSEEKKQGYMRAIDIAYQDDLLFIEDNEVFNEWLKNKHEKEAHEVCQEEYE